MPHCDPEALALAALGEQLPPQESEHLASCDECQAEVRELTHLVSLAREAPAGLVPPPDRVWQGVQADLGLTGSATPPVEDSQVAQAAPARIRGRLVGVAAVAAAVGALIGGGVVWGALDRAEAPRSETLVAQAVLKPLSAAVTTPGQAQVLDTADGLVVRVDARGLPPGSGFYEAWLLDADATKLVALGALPSGSVGTFTIPPGVRVADFPVVDISLEPYDGDPGHSHDSLLRGVLEA